MNDYEIGYSNGYQAGMIIDIGLWMLIGYLISKFVVAKMYKSETGKELPKKYTTTIIIVAGLVRAIITIMKYYHIR
ncbi:hypothetical protein OKW22_000929 [Bacilli bacterium PM5-3]|nr:hypothetical protein [Bacilli bacterium PM5-3]MDH6603289.1 hypothetical protein [Bacilli bacterium PM5-9]